MQTGFEISNWRVNLILVNEEFKNTGESSPVLKLTLVDLTDEVIRPGEYRKGKRRDGISYQPQPKTNHNVAVSTSLENAWSMLKKHLPEALADEFYKKIEEAILANWPE